MSDDVYVVKHKPAVAGAAPSPERIRLLREASFEECREAGMGNWDGKMVLLPGKWIDSIPDDLEVETINGKHGTWGELKSNDTRKGMLAFGWRTRS